MAADYKKILEDLKKKSKGSNNEFITFDIGDTRTRVLPGHPNMEAFFVSVPHHRKGKGSDFVKVRCFNSEPGDDTCLICPELEELRDSEDKEDKKAYKEQMAKDSFFFSAIQRADDPKNDKMGLVECGTQLLEGVLTLLCNPEYGDDTLDAVKGVDLIVNKSGKGMDTEYKVTPSRNSTPIFIGKPKASAEFIGTSAKDTKLRDLTTLADELLDDPAKALKVWHNGWKSLKDENADTPPKKDKPAEKPAKKLSKPAPEPEPDEEQPTEEAEEMDITSFPKLKSVCATCGDGRYKTPKGATCANGHFGSQLAEGERPSKPSKAWLKNNPEPEPEEEEVEEPEAEEEEEAPPAKVPAKKTKKQEVEAEDDDGLEELDDILARHGSKGKK